MVKKTSEFAMCVSNDGILHDAVYDYASLRLRLRRLPLLYSVDSCLFTNKTTITTKYNSCLHIRVRSSITVFCPGFQKGRVSIFLKGICSVAFKFNDKKGIIMTRWCQFYQHFVDYLMMVTCLTAACLFA